MDPSDSVFHPVSGERSLPFVSGKVARRTEAAATAAAQGKKGGLVGLWPCAQHFLQSPPSSESRKYSLLHEDDLPAFEAFNYSLEALKNLSSLRVRTPRWQGLAATKCRKKRQELTQRLSELRFYAPGRAFLSIYLFFSFR